jgi:hypothetical protein
MLTYRLFCSCQQQAGRDQPDADLHPVQNTRACSCQQQAGRASHPDADLQAVQNPEHALVSNKQERRASQMLTYNLFKTQSMLLSATSRKGQPDADLHSVQNTEHALVSNKQEGPARC